MARSVHQAPCEDHGEEIAKSIPLLKHTADDPPCGRWTVLKRGRSCIAVETSHCNTKQGSYRQKLLIVLAEASPQFQDDEKDVVYHKGPLPPVSIGGDTEDGRANRSKHEHKSNPPRDLCIGLVEGLGEVGDGQRDGEEVECVP